MAKESMKAREVKRAKLAKKYAAKREALKKVVNTGKGVAHVVNYRAVKIPKDIFVAHILLLNKC